MELFKRISNIISINVNELTKGLENPETTLKQAIREMEESIAAATTQSAKAMANYKRLSREIVINQEQVDLWGRRVTQSVEAGDDDLAKKAIAQKNVHKKLVLALENQRETASQSNAILKLHLDAMRSKLLEAKHTLSSLAARQREADPTESAAAQDAGIRSALDANAFNEFDRMSGEIEPAEMRANLEKK